MKTVNYKQAGTYYLVGNLFNQGIAFLTVPIFTRILSTTDYGIVTTYNSWIAILSMVIGFAIHMGIRATFVDYRNRIDDVMSVTTTFTLISGGIFSLIIGLCALLFANKIFALVVLCLLQGIASALTQNYSMYLMMQYRYKFRTALMILPNLVSVILSVLAILFVVKTNLYMGRIVPTALVTIGFGLIIVALVYKKSTVLYNKEYLTFALKVSTPLVLHGIALNILSQSDRTMITWLADASQTGIYSLVYNFSMLATVITTALEGVWVPWFTERLKNRDIDSINKIVKDYINVITYAMIALILVGPEAIKILADAKYWEGIIIIPPVVLANYLIFAYTLYVNVEHFHKKTPFITVNTLIAATVNVVLNFIFIPKFGYVAAAYTTLFAYFVAFVMHARYAKILEKDLYPISYFIRPGIHIILSIMVFYVSIDYGVVRWIIIIAYVVAMVHRERHRIVFFLPGIITKFKK